MCRQLRPGTGVRVILAGRLANLDSVQILEEIRLAVVPVDGVEFAWRTMIGEVRQHRVRTLRQHVRQAAGVRQQMADADGLALVLQVRIVPLQVLSNIVVQTHLVFQDGIGHQGARQGLAQRTDLVERRIGRQAWFPGFHVAAMTDEFLAPVHDADRGRMKQRLLDQRCGNVVDLRTQILRCSFLPGAACRQQRHGYNQAAEPSPVSNSHQSRAHAWGLEGRWGKGS
ncbi:hypothetical protein D3C72_1163740 [compost metagenome]